MTENPRLDRINRLINELEYELTRGMMQSEIDESLGFEFVIPTGKSIPGGVVHCRFLARPGHVHSMMFAPGERPTRLRVVK